MTRTRFDEIKARHEAHDVLYPGLCNSVEQVEKRELIEALAKLNCFANESKAS